MNKLEFAQLMYGEAMAVYGSLDVAEYCNKRVSYWRDKINSMTTDLHCQKHNIFVSDEAVMAYLLGSGRYVDTLKYYREVTGSPLAAARDVVERMRYEIRAFISKHSGG